eukprot:scaffold316_cov351-Prasinococcus_capsulatus_cf.AAC.8
MRPPPARGLRDQRTREHARLRRPEAGGRAGGVTADAAARATVPPRPRRGSSPSPDARARETCDHRRAHAHDAHVASVARGAIGAGPGSEAVQG